MNRKAVFFDIDGTLWDRYNHIPESTKRGIEALKSRGHRVFICSGRTRGYIYDPVLLGIGFDGIVSGCGTMIEIGGETVYYRPIERSLAEFTVDTVKANRMRPILEGREYLYMDREDFENDPYGRKLMGELGERLLPISSMRGKWEISKLSCDMTGSEKEVCYKLLEPYYDFLEHNEYVAEFVPKGMSKGSGLRHTCELIGCPIEDSIAIGDSANDLDMFEAAGVAVAMGNGSDRAKEAADIVTDSLHEDGIYNALLKLGLI